LHDAVGDFYIYTIAILCDDECNKGTLKAQFTNFGILQYRYIKFNYSEEKESDIVIIIKSIN